MRFSREAATDSRTRHHVSTLAAAALRLTAITLTVFRGLTPTAIRFRRFATPTRDPAQPACPPGARPTRNKQLLPRPITKPDTLPPILRLHGDPDLHHRALRIPHRADHPWNNRTDIVPGHQAHQNRAQIVQNAVFDLEFALRGAQPDCHGWNRRVAGHPSYTQNT